MYTVSGTGIIGMIWMLMCLTIAGLWLDRKYTKARIRIAKLEDDIFKMELTREAQKKRIEELQEYISRRDEEGWK